VPRRKVSQPCRSTTPTHCFNYIVEISAWKDSRRIFS
jgi:hypothetical protein